MLKFVNIERKTPEKRPSEERRADFGEIYRRFNGEQAEDQASRCSQCGIPFCQVHCPLHNNIPDWLMLTAEDRMEEAYELSSATNTFPEICGRICPQDRLCEGNCVIEQAGHGTVTIGAVESHITETAFENGWVKPPKPIREIDQSIGIIGAGPAALSAADVLRRKGYEVHVYDRYDRAGGLLVYGIPNFKLDKAIVGRRIELLEEAGIQLHYNTDVGKTTSFQDLRDRKGLGDSVADFDNGSLDAANKRVVVLGAGDTAMDCVRTAVRQGAESVVCLYRRDKANMPGSRREVQYAEEEGVQFTLRAQPEAFLGDEAVSAVRAARIHLGVADASGRQTPEVMEDSSFNVEGDLVIKALGFDPEDLPQMFEVPELGVTRWGTLKINFRNKMTNLDGVFAAGDIVRGASLVVWAIRDGREAASAMDSYLKARRPTREEAAA